MSAAPLAREIYLRAARVCFAIARRYHDRFMAGDWEAPAVWREYGRIAQLAGNEGNRLLRQAAELYPIVLCE
jgi:hypothetical protein